MTDHEIDRRGYDIALVVCYLHQVALGQGNNTTPSVGRNEEVGGIISTWRAATIVVLKIVSLILTWQSVMSSIAALQKLEI